MSRLTIKFPQDFERRYEEYRARLLSKEKAQESKSINTEIQTQDKRPYCEVKGKWGFLKFNKQVAGVKIGNTNAQPFKLLQCLTEPFGTAKMVDTVFEAIRENVKDNSKVGVYTSGVDKQQKIKLVGYVIKELQKDNKLQGKLGFKWDNLKTKVWLEYLGSNSEWVLL